MRAAPPRAARWPPDHLTALSCLGRRVGRSQHLVDHGFRFVQRHLLRVLGGLGDGVLERRGLDLAAAIDDRRGGHVAADREAHRLDRDDEALVFNVFHSPSIPSIGMDRAGAAISV